MKLNLLLLALLLLEARKWGELHDAALEATSRLPKPPSRPSIEYNLRNLKQAGLVAQDDRGKYHPTPKGRAAFANHAPAFAVAAVAVRTLP